MDTPWVVLISSGASILIVLVGRFFDKRRGIPSVIDSQVDSHVGAVMNLLKEEIEQRKAAEADCLTELAKQRDQRVRERDELNARIDSLVADKDALQAQVTRLLLQINGKTTRARKPK